MTGGMTVLLDVRLLVGRGAFAPLSRSPTMRSLLPPPAWGLVEPGVTSMEALPLTFCRTCSPARAHALRLVHHGLSTVARASRLVPCGSSTTARLLWLVPRGSCPAARPLWLIPCGPCALACSVERLSFIWCLPSFSSLSRNSASLPPSGYQAPCFPELLPRLWLILILAIERFQWWHCGLPLLCWFPFSK